MGESKSQPIYQMVFLPFIEWCVVVSAQENMRLYVFLSGPLQLLIPLSSYLYMNNINISPLFRKWLIIPPNFGRNAYCTQFIWFKAYPCQDLTLHYKQQITTIFYLSFITQFEVTHQTWRYTSCIRELYKTQTHHNEFFQTTYWKKL